MTEEEKKTITREKHPRRVAQTDKLAALMKKRKEEILRSKEQPTEQSTEQSTVQSTEQSTVQSTEHSSVQSTVQPTVQPTEQSTVVKWSSCIWRWYTCSPCDWCLCIFYVQQKGRTDHQ